MVTIQKLLSYMDEVYVPEKNVDKIYDLGVKIFHDKV